MFGLVINNNNNNNKNACVLGSIFVVVNQA